MKHFLMHLARFLYTQQPALDSVKALTSPRLRSATPYRRRATSTWRTWQLNDDVIILAVYRSLSFNLKMKRSVLENPQKFIPASDWSPLSHIVCN
jgi:hypothetical protein